MLQDLITVHNAGTLEEADIVVAWLDDRGVASMVKDRNAIGTFSVISDGSQTTDEVFVVDPGVSVKARCVA